MQTMLIIQLQIVPDKVLLGNRDTLTNSSREHGKKITKQTSTYLYFKKWLEVIGQLCSATNDLNFPSSRQKYATDHRITTYGLI